MTSYLFVSYNTKQTTSYHILLYKTTQNNNISYFVKRLLPYLAIQYNAKRYQQFHIIKTKYLLVVPINTSINNKTSYQ